MGDANSQLTPAEARHLLKRTGFGLAKRDRRTAARIRKTRGVSRVHFHLQDWERLPTGEWARKESDDEKEVDGEVLDPSDTTDNFTDLRS